MFFSPARNINVLNNSLYIFYQNVYLYLTEFPTKLAILSEDFHTDIYNLKITRESLLCIRRLASAAGSALKSLNILSGAAYTHFREPKCPTFQLTLLLLVI